MSDTHDQRIEKGAKALYDRDRELATVRKGYKLAPWADAGEWAQRECREQARAVLDAVTPQENEIRAALAELVRYS